MTISYKQNDTQQYMVTLIEGELTIPEIVAHIEQTILMSDSIHEWIELVDCSGVNNVSGLSGACIRNAASLEKKQQWAAGSRSALVVTSALHYGLARIFSAVASEANKNIQVFKSMDKAIEWLGLEEEKQELLRIHGELVVASEKQAGETPLK